MHYGHRRHIESPEDLTVLHCRQCGWLSSELTRTQMAERGQPWYCDNCNATGLHFVRFHPSERDVAKTLV